MSLSASWVRFSSAAAELRDDISGIAATEFAVILPLMLVMFFGTVEVSSAIAVNRKVTLVARTLSDLTSQSDVVTDSDLRNFFAASYGILTPYSAVPIQSTITQIYVNNSNVAKVQWSKSATVSIVANKATATLTTSPRTQGQVITLPAALATADTYLIMSESSYLYTPSVGYVLGQAGVTLADKSYTRPRQSTCVRYGTTLCTTF
jgi:Flp pilus assembly protein TadG